MNLKEAEGLVGVATNGNDRRATIDRLKSDPDRSELLEQLSRSRDGDVRGWIAAAAGEILGHDAIGLLTTMLEDRDADVRVLAMGSLEELDPASIPRLAGRLRRRLRSSNPYEALATSWALGKLGDRDAVALLQDYRDGFEAWRWEHKAADVVLTYMTEPAEIIRRIRDHDHDHMRWLTYAAKLIGTGDAIASLQHCADAAPDEKCRGYCAYSLVHDD